MRVACRRCPRRGAYRLARLAAEYGPDISLPELLARLSADCSWRDGKRYKGEYVTCGACLPDLDRRTPPDLPPGLLRLRVLPGGKA